MVLQHHVEGLRGILSFDLLETRRFTNVRHAFSYLTAFHVEAQGYWRSLVPGDSTSPDS